jgi:hypothetical protein
MKPFLTGLRPLAFLVALGLGTTVLQADPVADAMTGAANKFVDSLKPEQKAKATFEWKDDERGNWHFIPKDRKGLPLKEMTADQRRLALALLATGLSQQGYAKATNIFSLESILAALEGAGRRFPRDPELYYFSVFGQPVADGTWGWRVEGHHFAANFTLVKGRFFASTPSFFGTNPAEVRQGPRKGLRVLGVEEDLARQLVNALDPGQRELAVISTTAPKEIFTEAKRRVQPLEAVGVPAAKLTPAQRQVLLALIREYVQRVRPELADADLEKIKQAGVEKILFAWAGGTGRGEGHYYRVQGPTFLLEYDNTQNDNNHVHAVWRDFDGDFGEDLLKKHYAESAHGN